MKPPRHAAPLTAEQATAELGISRASLYAYVSRGLIHAEPHPTDPRSRLYSAADVARLLDRRTRMRRPSAAAASALDFGLPVLETSISDIKDGRLIYAGRDAVELAQTAALEDVAALLWGGQSADMFAQARFAPDEVEAWPAVSAAMAGAAATDRASALIALLLPQEPPGLPPVRALAQCARLVRALAAVFAPVPLPQDVPIADALAAAWGRPAAADAVRRALVLSADHELNASTFAVRVVASTGASLTACVLAGLSALSGPRHGRMTERVAAYVDSVARSGDVEAAVRQRLAREEYLPGFGHHLYPDGDPRARALLPHARGAPEIDELVAVAEELTGYRATIDVALVAVERVHALPPGSALALFALGRSVGWLAHALEQRQAGQLIRPRARFVPPGG